MKPARHLIKAAVDKAYWESYRDVRRSGVPSIHSRGRWVATVGGEGNTKDQCSPAPGAEAHGWRGTLRELTTLVELIEARYPHVKELYIEGGFDGASNLREYADGLYDPWVGSWEVCVWTRDGGWESQLCTGI